MHGALRGLGSNVRRFLDGGSDATLLPEVVETARRDESQPEGAAPLGAKRPKPAWWLLYGVVPLTALLFMLADLLSPTSGWRSASEFLAALVVLWAIGLWLRANRIALILADYCDQSESPREMP